MNCYHNNTILSLIFVLFSIALKGQPSSSSSYFIYTVTAEDKSLWGICQHHNVLLEDVKALNKLSRNGIHVGDELKIPKQTQMEDGEGFVSHIITQEDKSLWRICQNYAVSIEQVQALNNRTSSGINIGDILKIPSGHLVIHRVVKSDRSIWRISKNYGVSLSDLKTFNNKKNNVIRQGERILIPREWITKTEIVSNTPLKKGQSLWEYLGKPVFNLEANQAKFSFNKKKKFEINPKLLENLSVSHKLDSSDYARLYQQTTQRNSLFYNAYNYKEMNPMYYYSIEEPFLMDLSSLDYHPLTAKETKKIEHGYSYDFVTIIEVDSSKNSIQILPVFLYRDYFGDVSKYFGQPVTGAFSCCASPHPLAYYSKTSKKESVGFSELLSPSILKYTEVNKFYQGANVVQIDSTIFILQLETFDIPSLIDMEEFKNGKRTQTFARSHRRKKLGY